MILASLVLQLTAAPEATISAPILWGSLRAGMSKDEVKASHPDKYVHLAERCEASTGFDYKDRKLATVTLTAINATSDCTLLVTKTMLAKYGDNPLTSTSTEFPDCGYGTLGQLCRALKGDRPIHYETRQWVSDGTRIILVTADTGNWTIDYTAEPVVTPEAAGKL